MSSETGSACGAVSALLPSLLVTAEAGNPSPIPGAAVGDT